MLSTYATRFHASAIASGLTLPTVHGGGVALPGSDALKASPAYAAVTAANRRTDATAARFRMDALAGRPLAGGMRLDAAAKPEALLRDAYAMALVWEHSQSAAWRQQQRNDSGSSAVRADALTLNMADALTSWWTDIVEQPYQDLVAYSGLLARINRTVDPYADTYAWYEKDLVGVARAVSSYAMADIPMVAGAVAVQQRGPIIPCMVGMETNVFDAGRQALAKRNGGPDIDQAREKAEACARSIKEFINFTWLYGDPVLGIDGFHFHPAVATITLTGGPWSGKTAAQKAADLVTIAYTIPNSSRQLTDMKKLRLMLPPVQAQDARNMINSAAGADSVLSYFLRVNDMKPDQVEVIHDFASANSTAWTGGPQMLAADTGAIIYEEGNDTDPMFILPRDVEMPAPPRQNGLSETTFYHARLGGMVVKDARKMRYIAGL